MIARGRYVKGGAANRASAASHLSAHLKYLEYRSRSEQESRADRSIFSKQEDHVDRRDAVDEVMEHTSHSVSYHKIVLSPGEDEPMQDWHEWTREVMADLEEHQGKEPHWYAVHHSNTEHEHVHVIVAGAGEDRETGEEGAVKLYQEDYQQVRESGHEYSEYAFYHRLEAVLEAYEKQDTLVRDFVERDLEQEPWLSLD
jgi:type IV secretory pathway VirD2 relaxase